MKPRISPTLIVALLMLTGCYKLCKDRELSIDRQDYTGTSLRIDGYYYNASGTSEQTTVCYFYRNGIFHDALSELREDAMNGAIKEDTGSDFVKQVKRRWGTFRVAGNQLEIEQWTPSYTCAGTFYQQGQIQNDSTFVITRSEQRRRKGKPDVEERNDTFRFHAFAVKPDSLNDFIN